MPSAEILTVVTGASSFLGIVGLIAYLYFTILVRRAQYSVRSSLEGESLFNADQVLKVLSQFKDDAARLEALKTLTNYDTAKAAALLRKVRDNIDVSRFTQISSRHYRQVALISGLFFLILAMVAFAYSPKTAPAQSPSQFRGGTEPTSSVIEKPEDHFPKKKLTVPPFAGGASRESDSQNRARAFLLGYDLAFAVFGVTELRNANNERVASFLAQLDLKYELPSDPLGPLKDGQPIAAFVERVSANLSTKSFQEQQAFLLGWFGVISNSAPRLRPQGFDVKIVAKEAGFEPPHAISDAEFLEGLADTLRSSLSLP